MLCSSVTDAGGFVFRLLTLPPGAHLLRLGVASGCSEVSPGQVSLAIQFFDGSPQSLDGCCPSVRAFSGVWWSHPWWFTKCPCPEPRDSEVVLAVQHCPAAPLPYPRSERGFLCFPGRQASRVDYSHVSPLVLCSEGLSSKTLLGSRNWKWEQSVIFTDGPTPSHSRRAKREEFVFKK